MLRTKYQKEIILNFVNCLNNILLVTLVSCLKADRNKTSYLLWASENKRRAAPYSKGRALDILSSALDSS